ncbi:hypothetical protein [Streptomyces sp. NPDC059010]|uniref:hypothetical protein n=1 Tax=Streptomyces sp. NPDC059010 TaxID=3346695 RepID=UPI0036B64900
MNTHLFSASALLIALATAAYLTSAPHPSPQEPDPITRRARTVLCTGAFFSAFLLVPPVAEAVDEITGRAGAGALLNALTSGLTILSMQLVTVSWWLPTIGVRRAVVAHIVFYCCVMAVQVWEFQYVRASSAELLFTHDGDGMAAAFVLTHVGFLDVMTIAVSLQYFLLAYAAWPRWRMAAAGLAVSAVGTMLGLAYAGTRTGLTIAHLAGWAWPSVVETHVVPMTGALAAFFVCVGITLPTVAKRVFLPRGRSATGRAAKDTAVRRIALL